jgi:hypothetical protein
MELFKKIPMRFEEKEYEIRVLYDDTTINVVAFFNNHPVNGYRHQVKLPQKCNVQELLENYSANELIETSKNDIFEKRWEKLSKIIHEHMTDNV